MQRQPLERRLLRLALGDVAQDRDAEPLLVDLDATEAGLDREAAPRVVAAAQLAAAADLGQRLERQAVVGGQQLRERAAHDRAGAGAPKMRSAARLQDRTMPLPPKVTMASKLLSTSWRIMSSLAGRAPDLADQRPGLALDPLQHGDAEGEQEPEQRRGGIEREGGRRLQDRGGDQNRALPPPSSSGRAARAGEGTTAGQQGEQPAGENDRAAVQARRARSWIRVSKASACSSGPGRAR